MNNDRTEIPPGFGRRLLVDPQAISARDACQITLGRCSAAADQLKIARRREDDVRIEVYYKRRRSSGQSGCLA